MLGGSREGALRVPKYFRGIGAARGEQRGAADAACRSLSVCIREDSAIASEHVQVWHKCLRFAEGRAKRAERGYVKRNQLRECFCFAHRKSSTAIINTFIAPAGAGGGGVGVGEMGMVPLI